MDLVTTYQDWFASPLGRRVWSDERRVLLRLLGNPASQRIPDVGAGDGRWAAELAREGARVVAVDRDPAILCAARGRLRGGNGPVALVRADASELPFGTGWFDGVTAVTVLCVAARPASVVREMARVVHASGRVVLGDLGRSSLWAVARRLRGGIWTAARFWAARDLMGLVRDAGLEPGRAEGAVFYPGSELAARAFGGLEAFLGRLTTIGAAFIAVSARKPSGPSQSI